MKNLHAELIALADLARDIEQKLPTGTVARCLIHSAAGAIEIAAEVVRSDTPGGVHRIM